MEREGLPRTFVAREALETARYWQHDGMALCRSLLAHPRHVRFCEARQL